MYLFSFDYPPNDGGIARLCGVIAASLAQDGHQVSVLSQQHPDMKAMPAIDAAVPTTRVPWRRPWRELAALRHIIAYRGKGKIITGIWYPEGVIATLAGVKPHIVFTLGAELFPPKQRWRKRLWAKLQRFVLEKADVVVAISEYTESLVKITAPATHTVVVPLAVDHRFFCPGNSTIARQKWQIENKRVISSVARVCAFKGHDAVLQALATLPHETRAQLLYLVAGKGPDLAQFQAQARALGVDQQVRWLGFVPDEDLPSLYQASDLFVLMTRELPEQRSVEGFGLVFLEAQACGTPVVGTYTGGIPDAIAHDDGGWLIAQDDVSALTEILHNLVEDPSSFEAMGRIARARIEREFTWDHYIARLKNALASAGIDLEVHQ